MLNKFWIKTSLTFKIMFVFITLISASLGLIAGAKTAMAASLKPISVVDGDVLKLGDLFDGITRNADYVIGPAPTPGQDMTLNARTLYRIAVAMDLPWRPQSSGDQITIRREATLISYNTIENSLRSKLKEKGVTGTFNVKLNSGKPTLVLPQDMPQNAEISSLSYDHQKDYFQATIVAPSIKNPIKKISVTGLVERMVSIPVFVSNLQNGDIIGENDIRMISVEEKTLQHNVITKKEDLIGLTPRRIAYSGKYILEGTLQRPQIVKRGENVSITYQEGPLILTAKGKSLQSGAKGDIVRVTNSNSSRTIDAVIFGENQVVAR